MTRILVVAPSWIGDTLLAQPLFARLHEKHPGLVLDALAPAWTTPVLERMPEIAEVVMAPFAHGELRFGDRQRLGRSLRARRYDEAIVLPNTLKSALVPFSRQSRDVQASSARVATCCSTIFTGSMARHFR